MLSRRSFFKISGTTLVAVLATRNKVLRVLAAPHSRRHVGPRTCAEVRNALAHPASHA